MSDPLAGNLANITLDDDRMTMRGLSGHAYNLKFLSDVVRRRARRGLGSSDIKVRYCRKAQVLGDPEDEYYSFLLTDSTQNSYEPRVITIRVGGVKFEHARCSCSDSEPGTACEHVFWLLDQVFRKHPYPENYKELPLSNHGSVGSKDFEDFIEHGPGFHGLATNPGWPVLSAVQDEGPTQIRAENLLRLLRPSEALSLKFSGDPFSGDQSSGEQTFDSVFQQFKTLVTTFASEDDDFKHRLDSIITPGFGITTRLADISIRQEVVFDALEKYIDSGPASTGSLAINVRQCADELDALVTEIGEEYENRSRHWTHQHCVFAAGIIYDIIRRVITDYNKNSFEDVEWNWPATEGQTEQDKNLFKCLIGDPVDKNREPFGLDVLKAIPKDARKRLKDNFNKIYSMLTKANAPDDYLDYLTDNVMTEKPQGSPGSRKRPGGDDAGKAASKRR